MSASPLQQTEPSGARLRSPVGQLAYGAFFAIALPLLLAAWAVALDRTLDLPETGTPAGGMVLAFSGAFTMIAAIVELRVKGGGWPMSPYPPRRLVTTGPYALLAHPIYAGCVLTVFGVAMMEANAAGVWIVAPVLAAACLAFTLGSEDGRTESLFGRRARPLIHLPAPSEEPPKVSSRLSVYVLAILPWYVVYAAINRFDTPSDAVAVSTFLDGRIPVLGWTEPLYFLAYPLVLLAPIVARRERELRTLVLRAWIATGGAALCYVALPTRFEKKPVPETLFAPMLEWERGFNAPNTAVPAFHVIWVMLVAGIYARAFPRLRLLRWPLILTTAASCLTTGMHAVPDVLAGLALGTIFVRVETVWSAIVRAAERIAGSWAEWRLGPLRLIVHGLYGGLAVAVGIVLTTWLAGADHRSAVIFMAASIIVGAALWAQLVEGSSALLRPFGYYGGLIGGALGAGIIASWHGSGLLIFAAYGVSAPLIQALGRIRCLVQGCCHGRPAAMYGIRVSQPMSRVVRIAGLGGVPLHPTALYSIVANLVFTLLLLRLWIAGAPLTFIAGSYFILSGLERFVEEHYRGEPQTRVVGGLRLYQWLSIASVVIGAAVMTLPSAVAPRAASLSGSTLLVSFLCGAVAAFVYGADFPESNRRFARLA